MVMKADGHIYSQGSGMGICNRLRYNCRRLYLKYGLNSARRKESLNSKIVRRHRRRGIRPLLKCVVFLIVAATSGLGFFRFYLLRVNDRDAEIKHFISEVHGLEGGWRDDYDPKARVFVDPGLWHTWGKEESKGREKRALFLRVQEMTKGKGRPQLSLSELMALPSSFDPSEGLSDTTIILNQWQRTTLAQQLDAILEQSVRPRGGVWVCVFNSPREKEYRKDVENYRGKFEDFGGLFFVASSFNFKYYGRFQMALQARTRYVWIVDDDVRPGRKFLQQLSHIAGISDVEGADGSVGPMALGSVGWIMPGVEAHSGKFYSYRDTANKGGLFLPDKRYGIPVPTLQEVDLLCSQWFIETDWVKLLFREKWETSETGEDYMLAYSLRKFAGVRSYVLPMDLRDSQTWGNMDVEWEMQNQGGGATTRRGMVPVRDKLWHRLFKRGGEYFMSSSYAPSPRPLLLVVDNAKDAEVLRPLFMELQSSCTPSACGSYSDPTASASATIGQTAPLVFAHPRPPRVVLTGRGDLTCSKAAVTIGNAEESQGNGAILCDSDSFSSAWDLVIGKHYPRDGTARAGGSGGRDHALMVDLTAGLAGTVETLSPLAVVSVAGAGYAGGPGGEGGGGAAIDEALSLVTERNGVPFVRLPRKTEAGGAARWLSRLSPEAFGSWDRIRIDLLVVYDPANADGSGAVVGQGGHTEAQLRSLLDSLTNANFLGDKLDLVIASISSSIPEAVRKAPWTRGKKIVRRDIFNPMSAVMRSWVPRDDDNFVVVLEADCVVSEFFYSWLKFAVLEVNYSDGQQKHWGMASGVCTPYTIGQGSGGACLFPPDYWKWEQAACLGVDIAQASNWRGPWSPTPPKHYLYQSLEEEFDDVLVARTDANGQLINAGGIGLIKDHEAFSEFFGRVSFH